MSKIPKSLPVKCTISDIALEIPKGILDDSCIKAAVFVGRSGKRALTRQTKAYSVIEADGIERNVRPVTTLKDGEETTQDMEFLVLRYGSLNDVEYTVDMKPVGVFDGKFVFDKESHPLTVFAKVWQVVRPGMEGNQAKSVQESNMQEMLDIDAGSNHFSDGSDADGDAKPEETPAEGSESAANPELTVGAVNNLEEHNPLELVHYKLLREADCKERYLAFPKEIDFATVVNTTSREVVYSDRLSTKNLPYLGSVLSFKVTAALPQAAIDEFENAQKAQESKEEKARREKEEKLLEKERKKQEKEEAKRAKAEAKGRLNLEAEHGVDLSNSPAGATVNVNTQDSKPAPAAPPPEKKGFFQRIKGIISSDPKPEQTTPFPLKCLNTPFPFLVVLDKFELRNLYYPPSFYRGVHIRLAVDKVSFDEFPHLTLDTTDKKALVQVDGVRFDGTPCKISSFSFGNSHVYFGDKHIRNVIGFDTLPALREHEKTYLAKRAEGAPELPDRHLVLERADFVNVGERVVPVRLDPRAHAANEAQAEPSKGATVVAHLVLPNKIENFEDEKTQERNWRLQEQKRAIAEARARKKEEKRLAAEAKAREEEEKKRLAEEAKADEEEEEAGNEGEDGAAGGNPVEKKEEEEEKPKEEKEQEEEEEEDDDDNDDEAAATAELKPKKEVVISDASTFFGPASRTFKLSTYILNEERVPSSGMHYFMRFKTGEELHFRARRVFLPSVCIKGVSGALDEASITTFEA